MQTKNIFVLINIRNKGDVGTITLVQSLQLFFLLTVPRRYFFCGSLLLLFRIRHAVLSFHCSLVVICWDRADLVVHAQSNKAWNFKCSLILKC